MQTEMTKYISLQKKNQDAVIVSAIVYSEIEALSNMARFCFICSSS